MQCYVMDFKGKRAWVLPRARREHINRTGAPVSIGLVLGEDVTEDEIKRWVKTGYAVEVDYNKANTSHTPW